VKEHRDPQVLAEQISEKKIRTVGRPKKGEDNKFDIINGFVARRFKQTAWSLI
jgi:hypothetical protein